MLANVTPMSPTVQVIFWLAAFICFVLAACKVSARVELVALGLAVAVLVPLWAALVRT